MQFPGTSVLQGTLQQSMFSSGTGSGLHLKISLDTKKMYQSPMKFINMLLIWTNHRALPKCQYGQSASCRNSSFPHH